MRKSCLLEDFFNSANVCFEFNRRSRNSSRVLSSCISMISILSSLHESIVERTTVSQRGGVRQSFGRVMKFGLVRLTRDVTM